MTNPLLAREGLRAGGAYVVDAAALQGRCAPGDTATVRTTIDVSCGCDALTQQEVRCAPGRSARRGPGPGEEEVLYVTEGRGALVAGGLEVPLEAEVGVHVTAGTRYLVDNPG